MNLSAFARAYRAVLANSWATMVQYRAAVVLWTLWSLGGPVIQLAVWAAIAGAQGGAVGGFTRDAFVAYFLVQMIVYHFTSAWQVYEFSYQIRQGSLSFQLLRPFDPSHYIVAGNVAFKLLNLVWLIPIWAGLFWIYRPHFAPSLGQAALFIVTLVWAGALRFLWVHCWAMLSFWTVRASNISDLFEGVVYLVGGGVAPIAVLPPLLQSVAGLLPFRYMLGFPIEVALGRVAGADAWWGIGWMAFWTALFFVVYRALWAAGLKRFGAVGA
ncbi:MAG TPA: ABC-2 family transporter protein [Limnochordia bacterium]|nr:ABC-2 family transporter protein [Limnochordia bacterium]